MSDPVVADKRPVVMKLEPGKSYWWCSCGRSRDQPFCDGSHAGTDFEPVEFTVDEAKNYALCACKHSEKVQFCDGTHSGLD